MKGPVLADNAETYAQRATEMKAQAGRAETIYLQAIYASIADNWDQLAEQMRAAERAALNPPPARGPADKAAGRPQ
jgi:hypothetical protein